MCYMQNSFNFDKTLPYVIALTPMKPPFIADLCLVLHSQYIHKACNDVVCPLGRRYFLKKVVPSCSKYKITYRFCKTLDNTYEGVQFSEVTGLHHVILLKIDSFIDMKQRFQKTIHQNLLHSSNLFDKCRQLLIFK